VLTTWLPIISKSAPAVATDVPPATSRGGDVVEGHEQVEGTEGRKDGSFYVQSTYPEILKILAFNLHSFFNDTEQDEVRYYLPFPHWCCRCVCPGFNQGVCVVDCISNIIEHK
jgi:hypothetical protein